MQIVAGHISVDALATMAEATFGDLVKAVVDLRPGQGNRTRSVDDPVARAAIEELVGRMVVP